MSNTTNATDLQAVVDRYFECWNATGDATRSDAIRRTWAPDSQSSDPVADGVVALDGIDVAVIHDGLIVHLVGFFGYDLPAAS